MTEVKASPPRASGLVRMTVTYPIPVLKKPDATGPEKRDGQLHELVNGVCITCGPDAKRHFNPSEPRIPGGEHGGEWGHGGVGKEVKKALTGQDKLKVADRIDLPPGDHLVSSGSVNDTIGDKTAVVAHIDGTGGPRVRLGLVLPEDKRRWKAADKGATVDLNSHEAAAVHDQLQRLKADGPALLKKYRQGVQDGTYSHPEDLPAVTGTIPAGWGDIAWYLSLEEAGGELKGPDGPGGDVYDPGRWSVSLNVVPKGSDGGAFDQKLDPMSIENASQLVRLADLLQPPA